MEEESYEEPDERLVKAATIIQSVYRGYSYRHEQSLKETHQFKAKLIQKTWRAYVDRCKIHRVVEILALFRINRSLSHYRLRVHARKQKYKLQQFDELLGFFPAKSIVPIPRVRGRRGRRGRGRSSSTTSSLAKNSNKKSDNNKDTKSSTGGGTGGGGPRNRPSMSASSGTRSRSPRIGGGGPPRKRKFLVQLPPPWHDKDPKRLSQSQQDDLLFNQKSNFDWAKKELIPLLLRDCASYFRERDDLTIKNERYQERLVAKSFICPVPRGMKSLGIKAPKAIQFIGGSCLTIVAASSGAVILEAKTFTSDNVVCNDAFDVDAPLLDVGIHPTSGQIVGIDSHWQLRLFEHGRTIMSYDLSNEVQIKLPKATRFISFDKFGFFWVNLFAQRGPMLLFDPLTLQPSLQINLDNVASIHRFIRTVVSLTPLYLKDSPFGFAGVFSSTNDVYIFTYDFQKVRKLVHPKMKGFPTIKQANQRVFIWSNDAVVYVYELKEYMEGINLMLSFKMSSPPTDICATVEPDMIYISCEDSTVHVLLGRTTEHPLRLANSRMERDELKFCDILLGPVTYTKSRNAFKEMAVHKFTAMPTKIACLAFSEKMTLISAVFELGNICSVWMVNDSQNVRCVDFDKFKYSSPQMSLTLASNNFNETITSFLKKRQEYYDNIDFINKFDINANQGLMNNMFNPSKKKFNLLKYFFSVDNHGIYSYIPDVEFPNRHVSAYEAYHYLTRTHLLPQKTATFPDFLQRFAPPEIHKPLPTIDLVMNPKLPVRTFSHYMMITNILFDIKQMEVIVNELDPLKCLDENLDKFTISKTLVPDDMKVSRPRLWLSNFERKGLNRRLAYLSVLEDMVKHELMNRVQKDIDDTFCQNKLSKMQPITTIDIHQHAPRNDAKSINFSRQPNRNPLLDEKRHKSVYDSWSKYILFGRDGTLQMNVRALHVPSELFNSKSVVAHFEMIRRVSNASKKVSSIVHSFADKLNEPTTLVVVTEDSRALPLSHYLTIHSFLGGTSRLITAVRSIFSRVLVSLYQFHKSGIIIRTLYPSNILLNAANLSVTLGSVYDCQQLPSNGRCTYLPLPEEFAKVTNPFLPPEYFHESPRKYTTAFDVWQFGMCLLYVITGFLPVSYGSELMKHLDDDWRRPKEQHVKINSSNPLDDPPIFPRPIFFYDWMKGAPLVTEKERCTGERGECFFQANTNGINTTLVPTILELNNYKLLPYKNLKLNYDESRLFIEIIAECLQVEPEKRPTVEQLLKTYTFSQTAQVTDILDNYMRTPDPNVFVAQFFAPILNQLSEETFPFAIGIISALLFFEEANEEDAPYAFPLDARATEKVIASLFQTKFVDQLVEFVLKRISDTITTNDVNPMITYENECFDALQKFFNRFVQNVEKGTGALVTHIDEVIMSLLALYAGTPQLRHSSLAIKASGNEMKTMATQDNAALYVFTHSKLHGLVKYSLDASPFIVKSIRRFADHNDSYFDNFLSFSDAVYSFAHALCYTVEKQRANAIKTMAGLFQNGQSASVVRMFLDFHVMQKVIHCFYMPSARNDACSFICSAFRAIRSRSNDATFCILQQALDVPTITYHCASGIKVGGNEGLKLPSIEIIRNILFGESIYAISNLVYSDILFTLADSCKDLVFNNLVKDAVSNASIFIQHMMISSPIFMKTLSLNGIEFTLTLDQKQISEQMNDIVDVVQLAKKINIYLCARQSSIGVEMNISNYPVVLASEFLIRAIQITLKECDHVAKSLDSQAYKAAKYDMSPRTANKGKGIEKTYQQSSDLINEMCENISKMFECFCYFWRKNEYPMSKNLMDYLNNLLVSELPYCRTLPHPALQVHYSVRLMFLYVFNTIPKDNSIYTYFKDFCQNWALVMHHDILFVIQSADKETALVQLFGKYPSDKRVRERIFYSLVTSGLDFDLTPIFKTIINEMMWSKTEIRFDMTPNLDLEYHFPMRNEALHFVLMVLKLKDKYEEAAKSLSYELVLANFLENERHLTEFDDNLHYVNSSINLLSTVVQCQNLFSEATLKEARVQLESLRIRFSRQIQNTDIFKKDKNKPKLIVTSPAIKESWQKPLTVLQKRNNTYGSVKTARTARPATAFASTRKRIVARPITPR